MSCAVRMGRARWSGRSINMNGRRMARALYFSAGDQGDVGVYRVGSAARTAADGYARVVGGQQEVQSFTVTADGALAYASCTPG